MPEGSLQAAYLNAVAAVDPTKRVKARVRTGALDDWLGDRNAPATLHVLALGKAAARMTWGLVEANVPFVGLGVHPGGVPVPNWEGFRWMKGEHPVPGDGSRAAGEAVWAWLADLPEDAPLLVLLSGGASSVLERPRDGEHWDELVAAWETDLRGGHPIEGLNARRAERSSLKAGGLAARVLARPVRVWCISDVPPDRLDALGSGPFWDGRIEHAVLADNDDAVAAAGAALQAEGYTVYRHGGRVREGVEAEVRSFLDAAASLDRAGGPVALVGGGEPTLMVPADAPAGGRCQHAALLASRELAARGMGGSFAAGATDGRDGNNVAMAWSDAGLWGADAEAALAGFEASRFLDAAECSVSTGASGTNVADVWMWVAGR